MDAKIRVRSVLRLPGAKSLNEADQATAEHEYEKGDRPDLFAKERRNGGTDDEDEHEGARA